MSESFLKISIPAAGVLQIQFNRPEVLNALKTAVLTQIAGTLNSAIDDAQVRVVGLTRDAKAFAAGADIDELKQVAGGDFPQEVRQQAWSDDAAEGVSAFVEKSNANYPSNNT